MEAYAAIKRSNDNDSDEKEREQYNIKLFATKDKAAEWLLDKYEFWENGHVYGDGDERIETEIEWKNSKQYKICFDFLLQASDDDALFHWEWKRRGNFRTYKIVQIKNGELNFYARTKNLYKIKNMQIVKKS